MGLRNSMFGSWIAGITFLRNEFALTTETSLELRADFLPASLLERIGATEGERGEENLEEERPGPHPLILEMKSANANRPDCL